MPVRQLVNDPDAVVDEALAGFARVHAGLVTLSERPRFVRRAVAKPPERVALLSGGGSGHEPLHAGFVGTGMLDVAVPGQVFASPTALQILAATRAVAGPGGVLHIVKNYTGDVLNFSIARELATDDGIVSDSVLVDDDLSTEVDSPEEGPGRRGTAAALVVEKLCGAAAERGAGLAEVAALGTRVAGSSRSLAVALAGCTHPGQDRPSFELPDGMVELGIGIHGERGVERIPAAPARELVEAMTERIVAAVGLARGDAAIAVVNGLGATTDLELYVVADALFAALADRGIAVARSLCGSYVTALDMAGCSVTLTRADDELVRLWDEPVRTPALSW